MAKRRKPKPATWASVRMNTRDVDPVLDRLHRMIEHAIDADTPWDLLLLVSTWLHVTVGDGNGCRDTGYMTPNQLVETMAEVETTNASALLGVSSVLLPTEAERLHATAEFVARDVDLPDWLHELGTAQVVDAVRVPPDDSGGAFSVVELEFGAWTLTAVAIYEDDGSWLKEVLFSALSIDEVLDAICCIRCTPMTCADPAVLAAEIAETARAQADESAPTDADASGLHPLILEWFARVGAS